MPRPAYLHHPRQGTVIQIGPSTTRLLATRDDTDNRSSVYEMTVPADFAGPPPHVHGDRDHAFYILAGTVRLTLADQIVDAPEGSFAYIPAGVPHAFGNPVGSSGRILAFDTPGGWEEYLREMASTFPAGTPVDPARVAQVMSRYDTRAV